MEKHLTMLERSKCEIERGKNHKNFEIRDRKVVDEKFLKFSTLDVRHEVFVSVSC